MGAMTFRELRHRVTLGLTRHLFALRFDSFVRYAWWRIGGNRRDIKVILRDGTEMMVRRGREDYWILSEIFFDLQYDPPMPVPLAEFDTIVDVGANVGYSCLWFARACPAARILAFEPLPAHVAQTRLNIGLNGLAQRVELVGAAASTADGHVTLQPAGARTAVVAPDAPGGKTVAAVDWFSRLPSSPIDFLKMDIEGGERALLADARFAAVASRIRYLVIEWHDPASGQEEKRWCERHLREVGFAVFEGADYGVAGLLWGVRDGTGGEHAASGMADP